MKISIFLNFHTNMNYITSIEKAIIVFPLIALLFTIPFVLHQYHKYGSIHKFRVFIIYSFILYLISIYFLVILPLPKMDTVVWKPGMKRLIPFQFIFDFIKETTIEWNHPITYLKGFLDPCFYTVAFNILMTVPFGIYLRYYFKCNGKQVIWYTFLLSLFFEVTQLTGLYFIYPYPYRIFDVDDLMINTLGGIIGYILAGKLYFLPTRDKIDADARTLGEQVSILRRITVFCLDIVLYGIICFTASFLGIKNTIIIFFLYYGIYPILSKGKTLGSQFLNVSFETPKYRWFKILLRHLIIYFYYLGIPVGILYGTFYMITLLNHQPVVAIYISFSCLFIIFSFYLIHMIILFKKKKLFYDSLLKITYCSTIQSGEKNIIK